MKPQEMLELAVKQLDEAKLLMDSLTNDHSDVIEAFLAAQNELNQCKASIIELAKADGLNIPQSVNFSIRRVEKRTYSAELLKEKLGDEATRFIRTTETAGTGEIKDALVKGELTEEMLEGTYKNSSYFLIKERNEELNEVEI